MKIAVALHGIVALASAFHAASRAQSCGNSTGLVPLIDLGSGTYQGFEGGLYSGGSNTPPQQHLADALAQAALIVPRDASGASDPGCGLIGMISIGMSNTTHEFAVFERQEDASAARSPRVVILTCSQGGQDAAIVANPSAPYWALVQERVDAAGLTNAQVQVAWLKEALLDDPPGFPATAMVLKDDLAAIVRILRDTFPNLRLCYLSSRTYGGYSGAHPEPISYETGFAVKWLIEDQIGGDPALNWDPSGGPVEAPLCLWGPYLWADGATPRSDGLTWCQSDFENDGTHPSPAGEQKVADLLTSFFAGDPTAQPWYANAGLEPLATLDADADATVLSSQPNTNFGADATLRIESQTQIARAYVRFDFGAVARPVVHAKLSLRNPEQNLAGGAIAARLVADTGWSESAITFANAPGPSGTAREMPQLSRDGARSLDVTDWVNADADGLISIVLTAPASGMPPTLVHSREGGWGPRLVLSTRPGAVVSYCTAGATSNGCLATIDASGEPSIALASGFVIRATSVEGDRAGIVFYGVSGRAAAPWGASYFCVHAPVQRTPLAASGGTLGQCDGALAIDWLEYVATNPGALGTPFSSAQRVNAQAWFRDPQAQKTTNLSDAVEFYTCP
jgi:hypothetical protein